MSIWHVKINMKKVTFDNSAAGAFIGQNEFDNMKKIALAAKQTLVEGTGAGNDFFAGSLAVMVRGAPLTRVIDTLSNIGVVKAN